MASKYPVIAGGNWNTDATWTLNSDGTANATTKPTAADDVFMNATSGNVTIDAAAVCRSLNCTGYTGTLTHNVFILSIGDATAGSGNVALLFVAGMTYTKSSTISSAISFVSTSATQQTVTTAGKVLGAVVVNGAGGSWIQGDALSANGSNSTSFTLTAGTWNTGSFAVTVGATDLSNSNTRALTLGTTTWTTFDDWTLTTATNMTLSAASSTITITGTNKVFRGSSLAASYGTVNHTAGGTSCSTTGAFTVGTLNTGATNFTVNAAFSATTWTHTGAAFKTCTLSLAANLTISGTFTCNGNSVTNRVLVGSSAKGTSRTITAGTVSVSNADFQDITGAGAGSWNLAAITGNSGDCGGNSGITFTTPATQTATGTASFTWSTHGWTTRVPLPQDDVVINNAFVAGRTVTMDMPRVGKSIDFTGCTGSPTIAQTVTPQMFGSMTLVSGIAANIGPTFEGRGAFTLTSAGCQWQSSIQITAPGGTVTLQDALDIASSLTINNGTFIDNGLSTSVTAFQSSGSFVRGVTISGTLTVTGTGTVFTTNASTNLTLTATGSTIVVSNTSATSKTFQGGSTPKTFGNITFSGDNVTWSGINTYNNLAINNAGLTNGLKMFSGQTQTINGTITNNGSSGNLTKLLSSTGGSAATISKASGTVSLDWMSIQDSTATGGADFYAGANSTNVSGNTGWIFTAPPGGLLITQLKRGLCRGLGRGFRR